MIALLLFLFVSDIFAQPVPRPHFKPLGFHHGPPGATGASGSKGATGATGRTGRTGATGAAGINATVAIIGVSMSGNETIVGPTSSPPTPPPPAAAPRTTATRTPSPVSPPSPSPSHPAAHPAHLLSNWERIAEVPLLPITSFPLLHMPHPDHPEIQFFGKLPFDQLDFVVNFGPNPLSLDGNVTVPLGGVYQIVYIVDAESDTPVFLTATLYINGVPQLPYGQASTSGTVLKFSSQYALHLSAGSSVAVFVSGDVSFNVSGALEIALLSTP